MNIIIIIIISVRIIITIVVLIISILPLIHHYFILFNGLSIPLSLNSHGTLIIIDSAVLLYFILFYRVLSSCNFSY